MKRLPITSLAVLALLAGWYVWPLLDTRPEQDDCSFGSISNAEYKKMLSEVRHLAETKWPRFPFNHDGVVNDFEERRRLGGIAANHIREFSDRYNTMEGKVAAMHAVLRGGYGAIFWREDPLNSSRQQQFLYAIYKAKMIDFCWWSCWLPSYRWVLFRIYLNEDEFLPTEGFGTPGALFRTYGTFEETPMPSSDGLPCPAAKVELKSE